jgi:SprB repeat/CHU_C Type IX secretion signal domain
MYRRLSLFMVVIALMFAYNNSFAQGNACNLYEFSKDTSVSCEASCLTLNIKVPNVRLFSDNYVVRNISYRPCSFETPNAPVEDFDIDDRYSPVINLPFDFPFYGSTYSQMVIAGNGVVCFDVSKAGGNCEWDLAPANTRRPIPDAYYDRAMIMSPYHDMDPSDPDDNSPDEKVEVAYYGIAPNRKAVISFYNIPMYGSALGASQTCMTLLCTQQIVLHEGTGIIHILVQDKPLCPEWNDGLAILGIQNWDRDKAITPPDRNCTSWEARNESYEFIPFSAGSALKRVEVFNGGTLLSTGTVSGPQNLETLDVSFANVCVGSGTTNLTVKAYYFSLSDPNQETRMDGALNVTRDGFITVNTSVTAATCAGGGNGVITVGNTGPNLQYSIDGTSFQSSNIFTVAAGNYTITVQDPVSGCMGTKPVTVPTISPVGVGASSKNASCFGNTDGEIQLTANGGVSPYTFAINGGAFQSGNTFPVGEGTYTLTVKDAVGCKKDTIITITHPPLLSATATATRASCSGNPDGAVIVTGTGGTVPYEYSLDGSSFGSSNTMPANIGSYANVTIKDAKGCNAKTTPIVVALLDTMRLDLGPDKTLCQASPLTLRPETNATAYQWSPPTGLDNVASPAPMASPTDTITYYLHAFWGVCERFDTITINILKAPTPVATVSPTGICYGEEVQLSATGASFYTWKPANGVVSPGNAITIAKPSNTTLYIVEGRDNYGCNFKRYDSVLVTVRPPVRVFAGNDTIAAIGLPFQMNGTALNPGVPFSYEWTPSFGLSNPNIRNPVGILENDVTFTLIATTPEGCRGEDKVTIRVFKGPDIYVPSAFSPGGKNRIFKGIPVGIKEMRYFKVINRWGQEIFSSAKFLEGWDGRFKGIDQPQGVYLWMTEGVANDGKIIRKRGTVTLVR